MKFSFQSRENTLISNILFGIDDLAQNFGPIIDVLSGFMESGTKNKWNILVDIHCLGSEQI